MTGRQYTADAAGLLHLVDRAEAGTLLAAEAVLLRQGIRAMAAEVQQAKRTAGGLSARIAALRRELDDAVRLLGSATPVRVPCPTCRAPAGQRCRAVKGYRPPPGPHAARIHAAARALQETQ